MKKRHRVATLDKHRNEVGIEHAAEEQGTHHFEMMERIKGDGHLFSS
jgi:low affinity Fe/Cu permease